MKKALSIIFCIIAGIATAFMVFVFVYSTFVSRIAYKETLMWSAGVVSWLALNIREYIRNSKISGYLVWQLFLFVLLLVSTFFG